MREVYRRTASPELVSAVAHHEAGHAVATVLAFRNTKWLPPPPPTLAVRYVEVAESTLGQWGGNPLRLYHHAGWVGQIAAT